MLFKPRSFSFVPPFMGVASLVGALRNYKDSTYYKVPTFRKPSESEVLGANVDTSGGMPQQ